MAQMNINCAAASADPPMTLGRPNDIRDGWQTVNAIRRINMRRSIVTNGSVDGFKRWKSAYVPRRSYRPLTPAALAPA